MAGAFNVVTASTVEDLETKVQEWYEDAADKGLEDARLQGGRRQASHSVDAFSGRVRRFRLCGAVRVRVRTDVVLTFCDA